MKHNFGISDIEFDALSILDMNGYIDLLEEMNDPEKTKQTKPTAPINNYEGLIDKLRETGFEITENKE